LGICGGAEGVRVVALLVVVMRVLPCVFVLLL